MWLAKQDRCWTAERLAKRGLDHPPRCVLCNQDPGEIHHLLAACVFSREIWHHTLAWCKLTVSPPNGDLTLY
uniref:Reverse transcriptase zinc-binding domain-containing protein n=1 Tax=Aegilops tauschii subsp. strangulata TaxID=200361 RepID=A0A453N4F0_AEGTS